MNLTKILKVASLAIGGAGLVVGSMLNDRQMDESVRKYMQNKEEEEKRRQIEVIDATEEEESE